MRKILFLKHWQLFLLFVLPMISGMPELLEEIMSTIGMLAFVIWIYSIGFYGQEKIAALRLKPMNLKLFQFNWLYIFLMVAMGSIVPTEGRDYPQLQPIEIIFMILSAYGGFAVLQVLFFAAKTVAKVEQRSEVEFSDCIMNLLRIACFVLGVWSIQPRINRLIAPLEVSM